MRNQALISLFLLSAFLLLRLPAPAQNFVFQSNIAPNLIDRPIALAADNAGNLWVTGSNRVEKFDVNRNLVLTLGSGYNGAPGLIGNPGSGSGQFNAPYALTTDSANNLYIADTGNHRVQKFDTNGHLLQTITNGVNFQPLSIAVDSASNLYIVDGYTHKLQKYDINGNVIKDFALPNFNYYTPLATCAAIGPDDYIYVGAKDGNNDTLLLYLLAPDGSLIAHYSEYYIEATNITVDADGVIYVLDGDSAGYYAGIPNGNLCSVRRMDAYMTAFNGGFSNVYNIAADRNGAVYASQKAGIVRLDMNSTPGVGVTTGDTSDAAFDGVGSPVTDRQGNVYFITGKNNNVKKFDRTGHFLGYFPDSQTQGVEQLLTDSAGNILLIDYYGLKKFDTAGHLLSTVTTVSGGAAIDQQGNYYTANYYIYYPTYHGDETYYLRVSKYDANGNLLLTFPYAYLAVIHWNGGYPYFFPQPLPVVVDSHGNVFAFDAISGNFFKFDASGHVLLRFGAMGTGNGQFGPNYGPLGGVSYNLYVTIDRQDRLYVADGGNSRVQVFDDNGQYIAQFGSLGLGSGQFDKFGGIAADDRGNIYIANLFNNRVDIFAPTTNVTGTLALDGIGSLAGTAIPLDPVNVQFRAPGTTIPLFTRTVTLTPDSPIAGKGTFTTDNVPPGTYDLAFKTPKNLQIVVPNVPVSGIGYGPDVTLPAGDANNDNSVDILDFSVLVDAFGSAVNDGTGFYNPNADFNCDGKIDLADFGLLVNNYGSMGDP